ncbi:MAG: tetratricopeptide repeat protein [Phycisphaerales bacterium]|nr:MAG: tetratricopeptide repeat protein [Phycisphaerales bacterium]
MARTILTAVIIILLNLLVGCRPVDSGEGRIMPVGGTPPDKPAPVVSFTGAGEVDIVEQVAVNRQAYRQGLLALVDYYTKTGNSMKLGWAKRELEALDTMPKYKYIIEADVVDAKLTPSVSIPEADQLYSEAVALQQEGEKMVVVKDDNKLRLALDKYNELIRRYPSSDKIDDAAFRAGGIYDYFKDYSIALLYYQRAYQWNPETTEPARFRAAYILDQHMHRRAEALELYKEALETEGRFGRFRSWREYAEQRIKDMSGVGGGQ